MSSPYARGLERLPSILHKIGCGLSGVLVIHSLTAENITLLHQHIVIHAVPNAFTLFLLDFVFCMTKAESVELESTRHSHG